MYTNSGKDLLVISVYYSKLCEQKSYQNLKILKANSVQGIPRGVLKLVQLILVHWATRVPYRGSQGRCASYHDNDRLKRTDELPFVL